MIINAAGTQAELGDRYVVSYIQHLLTWILSFGTVSWHSTTSLRVINAVVGSLLNAVVVKSLLLAVTTLPVAYDRATNGRVSELDRNAMGRLNHTVVNICLFPTLFFFTGLYYTDVLSAFFVLLTYQRYLARRPQGVLATGILSLLFRQTNIFWVAVFLGGLEVARTIPKGRPGVEFPVGDTSLDYVCTGSWQFGCLYDPYINEADLSGKYAPSCCHGPSAD